MKVLASSSLMPLLAVSQSMAAFSESVVMTSAIPSEFSEIAEDRIWDSSSVVYSLVSGALEQAASERVSTAARAAESSFFMRMNSLFFDKFGLCTQPADIY